MEKTNILTIDLEEWFHSLEPDTNKWNSFDRRVEYSTNIVLDLLAKYNSKATFFVLGDVAENNPALIKEIENRGHEIGAHNYNHEFLYNQNEKEFRDELKKSLSLLESITGEKIISFRAPFFSITEKSLWSLPILAEEGIRYDSSIFPIYNHRYGIPNSKLSPHEITKGLWEFPISVYRFGKINFPFSGGVYFRFLNNYVFNKILSMYDGNHDNFVFYIHPWELDPFQPKFKTSSTFLNFRHYFGLENTYNKFENLLMNKKFSSIKSAAVKIIER